MLTKNSICKSGITLVVSLLFFVTVASSQLRVGYWHGILKLNDSTDLPFVFEIKYDLGLHSVDFINAEERISTSEVTIQGDSLFIKMPVFDSEFKIKMKGDSEMKGNWINHSRKNKNVIPFSAQFYSSSGLVVDIMMSSAPKGRWESTFSPGSKDASKSLAVFRGDGAFFIGTFLTETGDYRYLYGRIETDYTFYLSCFDGAHAFLFTGVHKRDPNSKNNDSIVNGHFYSGSHHHETWIAKRNDNFQLRNPDSLTYLKPGFTKLDFSFKGLEGKTVSLSDEKYKGKVVIVQIMGSWCPNCMDETKFLAEFHTKYKSKGLEVIALAFERTDDFNKAVSNVTRSKKRFNANYDFLITMKTGKDQASEALPMLNEVMAFPTTIYIDKKGIVRKIYTGFSGPATGDAYTKFVEDTTGFVEKLLAE